MTQGSDRPLILSHEDFVSEVRRSGRLPATVKTFDAYQFAAQHSNAPVWWITRLMKILLTFPVVCVALIILTFLLRDWRILLAIPAAIYGAPGIYGLRSYRPPEYFVKAIAQEQRRLLGKYAGYSPINTRVHQFLDCVALAGLCYTWFAFGWRSPWFLICAAYLVTFFECVIYHALCWRAFIRMLLNDPHFYSAAIAEGVIRY